MSDTKCYRWKREKGTWDRFRLVGVDWFGVDDSDETRPIDEPNSIVFLHQGLKNDMLIEVPDAPASWPLIDGSPKNPAAFEALYRTCVQALDDIESDVHISPQLLRLRESVKAALALADKGVGQ